MRFRIAGRYLTLLVIVSVLSLLATLTSCGLLGGDERDSGSNRRQATDLKVSIMTTTDLAPFHLANQKGIFADEGLSVSFVLAPSGNDSVNKLISGDVDIAYSSYTPFFVAESKGAAQSHRGIKLVAEASTAGPGSTVVVAPPTSPVKSVRDMAGKRVAITARGTISHLLVLSAMQTNGVDSSGVEWVEIPFGSMADRLVAGDVDAAFVTEPFIQDTERKAGAVPIFDTASGPTADIPTAGWASTGKFTAEQPKTIAAFQRAMQRATDLALSDRSLVEPLLMEYSKVDKETAKMAVLLTFSSKLDAKRLQRVPDLMLEFGAIPGRMDVKKMMIPTAPLN